MTPNLPEIGVRELAHRLRSGGNCVLLDVRETWELRLARIDTPALVHLPLTELGRQGSAAIPPELTDRQAEVMVLCHHGVRSAQVVAWLRSLGWSNAKNIVGGIDAYAAEVDPAVGTY